MSTGNQELEANRSSHLTLILSITRYAFSWARFNYYGTVAQFTYRMAFASAAVTYGIVVYKTWRASRKPNAKPLNNLPIPLSYLADENIQYLRRSLLRLLPPPFFADLLVMATVWFCMPQYPLAMLPYGIYSVFHVATYTRANLIPTVIPQKKLAPPAGASPNAKPQYAQHPLSEAIGAFVKQYYDVSMSIVSSLEILLWLRLFLAAIFFQHRSWILLFLYTAFLRARFANSSHVQGSFAQVEARLDNLVGAQGTPPAARQAWEGLKGGVRQFHNMTDVSRYVSGAAAPKKTS